MARFDLWTRRLELDATSGERGSTLGDVAALGWIRDRIALGATDRQSVDDGLRFLGAAVAGGELRAAAEAAARLRRTVAGMTPIT